MITLEDYQRITQQEPYQRLWEPVSLEPVSTLATLRQKVLEINPKRCPKRRFRLAPTVVMQLQPRPDGRDTRTPLFGLNLAKGEKAVREHGCRLHQWPPLVHGVPAEWCIADSTSSLVGSGDGKALTLILLPHGVRWFPTAMQMVNVADSVVLGPAVADGRK
jgi:hypothetical protein